MIRRLTFCLLSQHEWLLRIELTHSFLDFDSILLWWLLMYHAGNLWNGSDVGQEDEGMDVRGEYRSRFGLSWQRSSLVTSDIDAQATTIMGILLSFHIKISVGANPNSTEVCIYKVDINYHLFFALAVLTFSATWSKHCCKVQKYTFKAQMFTFKAKKHTFKVQKYTGKVQKYGFKVQKHTFKVQRYTFKVQSNFRNLGNGISETRIFFNTSDSRNLVPEPVPSRPWEQNLTCRNSSNETLGTQPSEPKTLAMPQVQNPVSRKLNPEPWNSKTCRNHRNA